MFDSWARSASIAGLVHIFRENDRDQVLEYGGGKISEVDAL